MRRNVVLFLLFTLLLTLISSLISELSMDSIWNFGFSYNIANGLIPYKDFNMIIGPFYNLIIALFLKIFGNYMIVFQIVNSAIVSIVLVFVFKKIKWNSLFLILFLTILPVIYGYNTFCAFMVIGILLLEDSNFKYKNILIGLLIGLILMTKHNIGLTLFIVYFVTSKQRIESLFSVFIPIICVFSYLIYYNAFFSYIDFCYLGMGNFLDNFYYEYPVIIMLLLIDCWLIYRWFLLKEKKILYLLAFQIINFPLFEFYHFMVSVIPVIFYIFLNFKHTYFDVILKRFIIGAFIIVLVTNIISFNTTDNIEFLKYNKVPSKLDSYLIGISDYINEKSHTHQIYLFLTRAYLIKINLNQNITFTDLINQGNLGKNESKYIDMIDNDCKIKKCLFILDEEYFNGVSDKLISQINPIFKDYVFENDYYLETLPSGDKVYVNYKIKSEN